MECKILSIKYQTNLILYLIIILIKNDWFSEIKIINVYKSFIHNLKNSTKFCFIELVFIDCYFITFRYVFKLKLLYFYFIMKFNLTKYLFKNIF